MKNNPENRRRVRDANKQYQGPITLPKKGGQPKVSQDRLLSWWNELEVRFRESKQRQADSAATVKSRYDHGKDGQVLPEIAGHVKKRRRRRNDK